MAAKSKGDAPTVRDILLPLIPLGSDAEPVEAGDLIKATGKNRNTVYSTLHRMVRDGEIARVGNQDGYYRPSAKDKSEEPAKKAKSRGGRDIGAFPAARSGELPPAGVDDAGLGVHIGAINEHTPPLPIPPQYDTKNSVEPAFDEDGNAYLRVISTAVRTHGRTASGTLDAVALSASLRATHGVDPGAELDLEECQHYVTSGVYVVYLGGSVDLYEVARTPPGGYALRSDNFTFYIDPNGEPGRYVDRETGLPVEFGFLARLLQAKRSFAVKRRAAAA